MKTIAMTTSVTARLISWSRLILDFTSSFAVRVWNSLKTNFPWALIFPESLTDEGTEVILLWQFGNLLCLGEQMSVFVAFPFVKWSEHTTSQDSIEWIPSSALFLSSLFTFVTRYSKEIVRICSHFVLQISKFFILDLLKCNRKRKFTWNFSLRRGSFRIYNNYIFCLGDSWRYILQFHNVGSLDRLSIAHHIFQ